MCKSFIKQKTHTKTQIKSTYDSRNSGNSSMDVTDVNNSNCAKK